MGRWNVGRRLGACSFCEREFEDAERHYSCLRFEGEELVRADGCRDCWAAREEERADHGDLFWWYTRYQASKKATLKLDLEALEGLFGALAGHTAPAAEELRYLLCLLLMRKRRLKLDKVERGAAGEALIVRRPRRKEELRVAVYDFDGARIDALRTKLQGIFDGVESDEGLDLDRLLAVQEEARGEVAAGEVADGDEDGEPDESAEEAPSRAGAGEDAKPGA